MKFVALCMMTVFLVLSGSGCSWMGQTTGKLQREIERKADRFETGYEQGYNEGNPKKQSGGEATPQPQESQSGGESTPLKI